MAESVIDRIKKAKSLVGKLQKAIDDMKQGGITPDEEKRIAENEKQISFTKTKLEELEAQFKADKAEWEGLSSDVATFQDDMDTVTEWEAIDVKALKSEFEAAEGFATAENYRDAIDRFKEVKKSFAKPFAEYEKQFEAMGTYNADLDALNKRLDAARSSAFQTEAVKQGVATLDGNLPTAQALADKKDYVAALDALKPASGELDLVEKAIAKAEADDAAVRKELEPVQAKADEVDKIEFEELRPRIDTAVTNVGQVTTLIDALDFNAARSEMGTLSQELDAIKAEAAKLEAEKKAAEEKKQKEKEEWERQSPRYEALKKQVGELEEFGATEAPKLRQIIDDIEGFVTTEDYVGAVDRLAQGEGEVKAPYAEYLKQQEAKKSYDATRPDIDKRAEAAHGNPNADSVLSAKLGELDADLTAMNTKADARDYIGANTGLAPATTKLDQIERDLRDLEMAAKVALEMGLDQSSPEVQDEIKRRVYLEEQPLAQGRIDKVAEADVLGGDAGAQFDQLKGEMANAETAFNAGSYAKAVEAVRTVIDEMPLVEDHVRKQVEKKNLYEAAAKQAAADIDPLVNSAYTKITGEAEVLQTGLEEGKTLAESHDYDGANGKIDLLRTGIDKLRADEAAIVKDHAAADAALTAIQSRLDEANACDLDELKPLQGGLVSKSNEVDAKYEEQDYKGALKAIEDLTANLEEFEKEAKKIKGKELYEGALETLDIEARVTKMTELDYPEADTEATGVMGADNERKTLASAEDYEAARTKAFEEGTLLDGYDTQKDKIELSRDIFQDNEPSLTAAIEEALAPPKDPEQSTEELTKAQGELKDLQGKIAAAQAERRFIEAAKLGEEAMLKAEEVKKIKFDSIKIDEVATNRFIDAIALNTAQMFSTGAGQAITDFRVDVTRMTTDERSFQKAARWAGFALNLASAYASVVPGGAVVAAVTGAISNTIGMMATEADDAEDTKDKAVEAWLIGGLTAQAGEVFALMSKSYSGKLKSAATATYEACGRHVTRGEDSEARAVLKGAGVPVDVDPMKVSAAFLSQLRAKMAEVRG